MMIPRKTTHVSYEERRRYAFEPNPEQFPSLGESRNSMLGVPSSSRDFDNHSSQDEYSNPDTKDDEHRAYERHQKGPTYGYHKHQVDWHDDDGNEYGGPQTRKFVSGWNTPNNNSATYQGASPVLMTKWKDKTPWSNVVRPDRGGGSSSTISEWVARGPSTIDWTGEAEREMEMNISMGFQPLAVVEFGDFLKARSMFSELCCTSIVNETTANEQEQVELDKESYRMENWNLPLKKPHDASRSECSDDEWIPKLDKLPTQILGDVTEEVESRDLQYEVLLGPSERAALSKNLPRIEEGQPLDQNIDADLTVPNYRFVRVSDHSMASDPLNRAMLHTTNDAEFIEQAHAYRKILREDCQYSNLINETLEVARPDSKFRFVMERGGLLRQLGDENQECCSLIAVYPSTIRQTQQLVYEHCKRWFTTFKSCRIVDIGEAMLFAETDGIIQNSLAGDINTLILVEFWQVKDAMEALSQHPPGFLKRVPTRLLCGARNSRMTSAWESSSNYSANFMWTNRPTTGMVVIHIHPQDNLVETCSKVLEHNGYEVKEIREGGKYISIFVRCKGATNGYIYRLMDDEPVVAHIRACLNQNGVNADRIIHQISVIRAKPVEFKSSVRMEDYRMRRVSEFRNVSAAEAQELDREIRRQLHIHIVMVALLKEVWPYDRDIERSLYCSRGLYLDALISQLIDHEETLPWTLELRTDHTRPLSVQSAFVVFKNEEMGRVVVEHMQRTLPDRRQLRFNPADSYGVRCFSAYSHYILVRKDIRIACHKDIHALGTELRSNSEDLEIKGAEFARIVDVDRGQADTHCLVRVDAWPPRRSHDLKRQLEDILAPTFVDCSNSETTGLMRQGYGWWWTQRQCKKNNVVVEKDLYLGKLVLYGSHQEKYLTKTLLNDFFNLRNKMKCEREMYISQPQYLRSMRAVLGHIGIPSRCVKIGWKTTTSPRNEDKCEKGKKESGITQEALTNSKTPEGAGKDSVVKEEIAHDTLRFYGTVDEFDRIRDYLDQIDEKLTSMFSTTGRSASRPSCVVCMVPVRRTFICLQTCGHYYCLDCLVSQMHIRIRDRKLPLKCEFETCGESLVLDDIFHILSDGERRDSEGLRELMNAAVDVLVRQSKGRLALCRTADCTGLFVRSDSVLRQSGKQTITAVCDDCGVRRCLKCLLEPHPNISCLHHSMLRDNPEFSVAEYIRIRGADVEIRQCPTEHCGAVIEKGEGCAHVHCSLCGVHFCWLCNYMSETLKDVYAHMRDVHNTFGGGWRFEGNEVVEAPVDAEDAEILHAIQRIL